MNLSYFRKSLYPMSETIARLKDKARAEGFSVLGETLLPDSGATVAEIGIRKLIDDVSGAGNLRPTAVKLYSTRSCPYCRMEKAWLDSQKLRYELIYVDDDQAEAESLVNRTGQMSVPVTELLYDDHDSEFILGFDQAKLAQMLS